MLDQTGLAGWQGLQDSPERCSQPNELEIHAQAMYSEFLLWKGDWDGAENAATDALGSRARIEALATRVLGTIQARRGRNEAHTAIFNMWSLIDPGEGPNVVDTAAAVAEYLWLSAEHNPALVARLERILADGVAIGEPWPSGPLAFLDVETRCAPEGAGRVRRTRMRGSSRGSTRNRPGIGGRRSPTRQRRRAP